MITIKNLHKTYNEGKKNSFTAIKDINLTISKNTLTIVKGISGSGKSTLLSLIAGFAKPTQGEVLIGDTLISKLPEAHIAHFRRRHIGFVFQSFALIEDLSVYDNILAALVSAPPDAIGQTIADALQKAHIEHKETDLVKNLSGGEKQRVAIARALANTPEIIIADEPTANLDHTSSLKFLATLGELKNMGKTLIVATHDSLFDAHPTVDRIITMSDGVVTS